MKGRGPVNLRVPEGDDRERLVCDECGFVNYVNPKVVVGVVATAGERILMCRRAIEPRRGFWTIPAGYLEENESPEVGAAREAWEEARARLTIDALLAVYSVPRISQVQLMYRARLTDDHVSPGAESLEVALYTWEQIPWTELAFPTVAWALEHHRSVRGTTSFCAFTNPSGESPNLATFASQIAAEDDSAK
ncbi:MAG: NUDIX hydrolase [Myxococcota bacterium]